MGFTADLFQQTLGEEKFNGLKKKKNIAWLEKADLRIINDEKDLRAIVAEMKTDMEAGRVVAVDTETEGLRCKTDKLVGLSLAWRKQSDNQICAFYVPLMSEVDKVNIPSYKTLAILKPILEKKNIYYNYKFDMKFIRYNGIEADLLADVQLMQIALKDGISNEDLYKVKQTSLKERFKEVFGNEMLTLEDALGKHNYNFAFAPLSMARMYAAPDAFATLALYEATLPKVDTNGVIYKLETELLKVVGDMEYRGIRLDQTMLMKARDLVKEECDKQLEEVFSVVGEKFDVNSPQQLGVILYDKLQLPILDRTEKTGKPKTDAKTLDKLRGKHKLIDVLLKYKENEKLLNTFLDKLPTTVDSDGHIHTSYHPWGAVSGRFTSSEPNLQQIPKAKKEGTNKGVIRKAFTADLGYYLLDVDYSQIEYRVFASKCGDKGLIKAFNMDGVDFHQGTAATMFGISPEEVTDELRAKGKTINFGLLFGMGPKSLSGQLKCSVKEAQALFDAYFKAMPEVQPWIEAKKKEAIQKGYTESHYGRKRLLPEIKSQDMQKQGEAFRAAVNHSVQGTAADILKIAMVRLARALKDRDDIQLLLQVHDELVFQVKESTPIAEAVNLIQEIMERPIEGFVPIVADFSVGYNWGTTVDYYKGLTIEDIPVQDTLTINTSDKFISEKGIELKQVLEAYKGKSAVYIVLDHKTLEAENKVCCSRKLMADISKLGFQVVS